MASAREPVEASLMTQALSLSASYVRSVLPVVAAHYGLSDAALLQRSGISPGSLDDPAAMLPFERVAVLFLNILTMTRDEAIGLVAGSSVQPRSYQVMGYAILGSDTLAQAINRLVRYEKLVGKLGHSELRIDGDVCELVWHAPMQGVWACYLKEAAIAGWITFARNLVAEVPRYEVCFDHPRRGALETYARVLGAPVHFEQSFTGVRFATRDLDTRLATADPGLCAMMDREAQAALAEFDSRINLINEVRSALVQLLPQGEPTLDALSERVGVPVRPLQARLRENGTHFKQLVDEVRQALAGHYLQRRELGLIDIGFLLGFSEQSAFSRAFRRWHGVSPQQFQKTRVSA